MQQQKVERGLPKETLKRFFWLALFIAAQALLLMSFLGPFQKSARILACDMVNIVVGVLVYWLTPKWKLRYRILAFVGATFLLYLLVGCFIDAGNFVPGMGRMQARFLTPLIILILWPLGLVLDKESKEAMCDALKSRDDKENEWD